MLVVSVFCSGALMLCVALHVLHGQQLIEELTMTGQTAEGDHRTASSTETGDSLENKKAPTKISSASTAPHHTSHHVPCFVDDIFASLHEGVGVDGELSNDSLTLFGVCTASDNSSSSVLLELAEETSRNQGSGLKIFHPAGVLLAEDDESELLELTFDLPQSPLLKMKPVLLLAFESPLKGGDLDVTFTSLSLQPNTQSVCLSGETQYIILTGKTSEVNINHKWRISIEANSPDMKQKLKGILIGGKSRSISMTPLLLFSGETRTETRHAHVSRTSSASSQTFSFLCELKRFLGVLLPRDHPESPPLKLDSLQSLPPLTIGLSSSETLLAGLIKSSAPTVFSFASWGSMSTVHHGLLALSPTLLEELRQRLEQTMTQIQDVIQDENTDHRAAERLERLKQLSVLPIRQPASGVIQYRAFLLLKALQTVAQAYELQRSLRATRADFSSPENGNLCGLRSLTVSLEKHLMSPHTVNINNCYGSCRYPLANANNHAVLLSSHVGTDNVNERAPCCVPLAYDPMQVVDYNEHGSYLHIKQDMVATMCGCR